MATKHVMVDIETLGTRHDSAIVSIGAVSFDPLSTIVEGDNFYHRIDLDSCLKLGLKIDGSTIRWWMQQSDEARGQLTGRDYELLPIVLAAFTNFLNSRHMTPPTIRLWSHGANFDAVLLESAYRACDLPVPWKYDGVRCTRTIFDAAGVSLHSIQREGEHHNALDDARHQARVVQLAYRRLDLRGVADPVVIPRITMSGQPKTTLWGDSHSDTWADDAA